MSGAADPEETKTEAQPANDAAAARSHEEPIEAAEARVSDDLADLAEQVGNLTGKVADLTSRLARARADYENLQRRVERDAEVERDRAKARVLEGFLTVFEYGQMAAQEAEKQPGALAEGVRMVVREFERLLESEGVRRFGARGEPFDPSRHEAVGEAPADGVEPGAVAGVVRPGYLLGERVLRFAKVTVATTPEATGEGDPHDGGPSP